MRFVLIDNAKNLWHRLWSVRLALLAAVLSAFEVGFQYYASGTPHWLSIGVGLMSIFAAISRLIAQDQLSKEFPFEPTDEDRRALP